MFVYRHERTRNVEDPIQGAEGDRGQLVDIDGAGGDCSRYDELVPSPGNGAYCWGHFSGVAGTQGRYGIHLSIGNDQTPWK